MTNRLVSVGDDFTLPPAVKVADANLPVAAQATTLATSYAQTKQARPGNLAVFLGDSITAGADDIANNARGEAWPVYATIFSGQKIRYVRNAGVPGNKTAQMLARFDTDVTPYAPNIVTLLCGTNDTGVTDFVAWQTDVKAIIAKVRAIGAVPVIGTMPPNSTGTPTPDRKFLVNQWNAWIRRYAATEGIVLLDFYAVLADPVNGSFLTAYNGDGTHPSFAGAAAMGSYANTVLAPLLPPNAPVLCQDDYDETNAVYKGCFTGYTGSTLPTGWVDNAGIPSGSVLSYTTDSQVPGQMVTITSTATAGPRQVDFTCTTAASVLNSSAAAGATSISITVNPTTRAVLYIGTGATAEAVKVSSVSGSGTTWTVTLVRALRYSHNAAEAVVVNGLPGDKMLYTGRITADGGVTARAAVNILPTGSARAVSDLSRPITRGVFLVEFTVPTGTTQLHPQIQVNNGTGVVSFGQIGLYNLTRLGLA